MSWLLWIRSWSWSEKKLIAWLCGEMQKIDEWRFCGSAIRVGVGGGESCPLIAICHRLTGKTHSLLGVRQAAWELGGVFRLRVAIIAAADRSSQYQNDWARCYCIRSQFLKAARLQEVA